MYVKQRDKRKGLKRIERHTNEELDAAIEAARLKFGEDFWVLLHGVDAYMERRKRRTKNKVSRLVDSLRDPDDMWGSS
jgi:hypothetical protein